MLWFYVLVVALVAGAFSFYRNRHATKVRRRDERNRSLSESSAEIGAPAEVLDREKALLMERQAGVELPRVEKATDRSGEKPAADQEHEGDLEARSTRESADFRHIEGDGSLKQRRLRKDALSKEVELDWEAADIITLQPGAWAREAGPDEHARGKGPAEGYRRTFVDHRRLADEERYVLPGRYGYDRLVLMARDPHWVYAYWELAHERYQELFARHHAEWNLSKPILRFYDLSEHSNLDIPLNDEADNWYVRLGRPRHRFMAEMGRLFPNEFVPLLRSNEVVMPPETMSDVISDEWAPLGWESYYGGPASGTSSPSRWGR